MTTQNNSYHSNKSRKLFKSLIGQPEKIYNVHVYEKFRADC